MQSNLPFFAVKCNCIQPFFLTPNTRVGGETTSWQIAPLLNAAGSGYHCVTLLKSCSARPALLLHSVGLLALAGAAHVSTVHAVPLFLAGTCPCISIGGCYEVDTNPRKGYSPLSWDPQLSGSAAKKVLCLDQPVLGLDRLPVPSLSAFAAQKAACCHQNN